MRYGRGRDDSVESMGGGWEERTLFGGASSREDSTVEVWRRLREGLRSMGGMTPFVRRLEMEGRNRDWRVCLMDRGPEGVVTVWKEG